MNWAVWLLNFETEELVEMSGHLGKLPNKIFVEFPGLDELHSLILTELKRRLRGRQIRPEKEAVGDKRA